MKEFVMYQNENIIWWANFINDELRLEFKPSCPNYIKEMWDKLNEPIRR